MKKEEKLKTLKFPFRFFMEIVLLTTIIYFIISFINGTIIWDNPQDNHTLIFIIICLVELFYIIYLIRNKTFLFVDKYDNKYIIKLKELVSNKVKDSGEEIIKDHYIFDDSAIDILNLLEFMLRITDYKTLKSVKKRVQSYSKFQIEKVDCKLKFLGIKLYKIEFKNNKTKQMLIFNKI